ncbi:hypothetical protein BJ508DRAFT_418955 [Ascobolus immersus RN42]|uniref:Uncharacterized protein n=1 Tax=Ascobolus immersus RN42 TaxID=1160509 RepID=A0A3N4HHZ6_ASCIM|nr:hypothetical protein BJ508DRAFT_418955 [Ascobolus immersus RN42]
MHFFGNSKFSLHSILQSLFLFQLLLAQSSLAIPTPPGSSVDGTTNTPETFFRNYTLQDTDGYLDAFDFLCEEFIQNIRTKNLTTSGNNRLLRLDVACYDPEQVDLRDVAAHRDHQKDVVLGKDKVKHSWAETFLAVRVLWIVVAGAAVLIPLLVALCFLVRWICCRISSLYEKRRNGKDGTDGMSLLKEKVCYACQQTVKDLD